MARLALAVLLLPAAACIQAVKAVTGTAATAPAADADSAVAPWPGTDDVTTVDDRGVFGGNLSGLRFEAASATAPAILWGVRNGPSTIFRLVSHGEVWRPDTATGWSAGKTLLYPDGTGEPDAEGITIAGHHASDGVYVSVERNNAQKTISRNSILRFDVGAVGTTVRATHEWVIGEDLPVTGANLGAEAITWIPDSMLVANGFVDESKARPYVPADYPAHGAGVFFVGLEANGVIYAYTLNHASGGYTRIATIPTGFPGVMDLSYDLSTGYLWAICDDGCGGLSGILEIDRTMGSPTRGHFKAPRRFARPSSMPNINNEGFTVAPASECQAGRKPVFWADDSETDGHAIRRAFIPCGAIP